MSEYTKESLKKLYPTMNFDVQLTLTKISKNDIEKHTGQFRKQQGENISNPTNDFVPKVYITQDIQHDAVKDEKMTQGVQDYLDAAIHNNVDKIIDPQSLDNEGLDVNVTQEEEGSVTSNEELYKITEQQYSDDEEGLMDINETQEEEGSIASNEDMYKITEQQYSEDEEGSMDVNGVPRNVEISNPEYNYNQNIKIKQEIMDDSYNATYPVPRNVEISNPEYNYNQNIKIKQEIMNDSNQATYPYVNVAGFL